MQVTAVRTGLVGENLVVCNFVTIVKIGCGMISFHFGLCKLWMLANQWNKSMKMIRRANACNNSKNFTGNRRKFGNSWNTDRGQSMNWTRLHWIWDSDWYFNWSGTWSWNWSRGFSRS